VDHVSSIHHNPRHKVDEKKRHPPYAPLYLLRHESDCLRINALLGIEFAEAGDLPAGERLSRETA
jgi:hypothetical protein